MEHKKKDELSTENVQAMVQIKNQRDHITCLNESLIFCSYRATISDKQNQNMILLVDKLNSEFCGAFCVEVRALIRKG